MQQAIEWWQQLTESGGEGMVVKPLDWIARGPQGLVQPAVKCRGKEYLRIIYSADYDADENLPRLRQRPGRKRSFALREFALGIEGLERFVRHEPYVVCTNAPSVCWPWKANRSIHDCRSLPIALSHYKARFANQPLVGESSFSEVRAIIS